MLPLTRCAIGHAMTHTAAHLATIRARRPRASAGPGPRAARCGVAQAAVEVAGIEPASFGAEPGLLRAQPACAFLGPSSQTGKLLTGPVAVRFPIRSRDRTEWLSLLADARHRAEGTPGLTACSRYLGSESVGALIGIGAYWCAGPGFRDHPSHPRPASPGSTTEVETIHPLCSCASSLRGRAPPAPRGSFRAHPGLPTWVGTPG
jgi:hypothetical protein